MLNASPAVAGGAVYLDSHYGKVYALKRWVVSISAPECQFRASVPGYSAAAASIQIGSGAPGNRDDDAYPSVPFTVPGLACFVGC